MDEFTFGVICYNQEQFIIECLESIKYQIVKYGNGIRIHLVIADDHSMDNTVKKANLWVKENESLFQTTKVLSAEANQGIVRNIMKLYREIPTLYFKTVSGDDLFSNHNIFISGIEKKTILVFPVISMEEGMFLTRPYQIYRYYDAVLHKKGLLTYYRHRIHYYFPVSSIGLMFTSDYLDSVYYETIEKFKWVDDIATFNYIINKPFTKIEVGIVPYIIYRDRVGISGNKKHEKRTRLAEDYELIRKTIFTKNKLFDKRTINPVRYFLAIERYIKMHFIFNHNNDVRQIRRSLDEMLPKVKEYYSMIKADAEAWESKHSSF